MQDEASDLQLSSALHPGLWFRDKKKLKNSINKCENLMQNTMETVISRSNKETDITVSPLFEVHFFFQEEMCSVFP